MDGLFWYMTLSFLESKSKRHKGISAKFLIRIRSKLKHNSFTRSKHKPAIVERLFKQPFISIIL